MSDLKKIVHSKELGEAARASSKRWLDDSKWKPITLEEYVKYLDEIQRLKEKLNASNRFLKLKKRANNNLQLEIDRQVKLILDNYKIGELKKGDLKRIRIHKFKFKTHLYLLSYEVKENILFLYLIGSHENYYKKLKKYLSFPQHY